MVARGERQTAAALDRNGRPARATARTPGFWQPSHRTDHRPAERHDTLRLARGRSLLRNRPAGVTLGLEIETRSHDARVSSHLLRYLHGLLPGGTGERAFFHRDHHHGR